MQELMKIRDVSSKYDISARTLRYYEDMGLITSTRSEEYAYRLYDEAAIKRLEQILILRKLNISIKDIQRIFSTSGSEVVLEVLGKKVDDIDGEAALLHELKEIILEFIRQIEQVNFGMDSDVKMLYEKAKRIESTLVNISYDGNPSNGTNVSRLVDVTEKLRKNLEVRIVQIHPFRAVSSGLDTMDHVMEVFNQWQEEHHHLLKKSVYGYTDFLWFEEKKAHWVWEVEDWVTEADTAPYEITEFEGGLYAVATSVDGDDDINGKVYGGIKRWLETSGFERDERPGHRPLLHMVNTTKDIKAALGFHQLDIYVPIIIRRK